MKADILQKTPVKCFCSTENTVERFSLLMRLQASIPYYWERSEKAKVGGKSISAVESSKMDKRSNRPHPLQYKDIATLVMFMTRCLEKILYGIKYWGETPLESIASLTVRSLRIKDPSSKFIK